MLATPHENVGTRPADHPPTLPAHTYTHTHISLIISYVEKECWFDAFKKSISIYKIYSLPSVCCRLLLYDESVRGSVPTTQLSYLHYKIDRNGYVCMYNVHVQPVECVCVCADVVTNVVYIYIPSISD